MNENPKILIVSDEPMLLVDLLYELEGRGFTVLPRTRGDYALCSIRQDIDAAVFDFRHPDQFDMKFVSGIRRSGIPVVMCGGGSSTIPVEISGAATCISKPIDYDELTGTLHRLADRVAMSNFQARGGAIPLSQSIPADRA
jgi:DNA-binding response OmpR family regulator